jgi:plastocyanin
MIWNFAFLMAAQHSSSPEVRAGAFRLPPSLVQKGTQVPVTNNGVIFHTFCSYTIAVQVTEGFKTLIIPISDGVFNQTLAPGQSWTLDTSSLNTGTYTYACLFHPWMKGVINIR